MIKFALRPNLIYPLQLIIWNLLRKIETILISYLFNFSDSLIYTPLMFLGEFLSGLVIFLYQKKFLKKEEKNPIKFFSITLIQTEGTMKYPDNNFKIFLLIFFVAFFDFIQFMIWTVNVPKFINLSGSIVSRLSGILTLSDALFYYYVLRLQIYKHQIFSLIIITIGLIIVIITEFFFQEINIFLTYSDFIIALVITFLCQVLGALIDAIEKYLYEYDFFNPFFALMIEGVVGFFLSFFLFFIPNYLEDIKLVYNNNSAGRLILFSFLLLLYIILSGGRNVFRVVTTKLYSPMARALTDYFLNPIYLTYDFSLKNDFLKQGERNIPYFIVNLILSFIISICGCVYNEFIVLLFCGLEINTHDQIARRASGYTFELEKVIEDTDYKDNDDSDTFKDNNLIYT